MPEFIERTTELYHLPGFHEPFSAISHLLGAVIFLVLGLLLLRRGRGSRTRMIWLGIYAFCCVLLMAISGTYHMIARIGTAHVVMERLDHSAIFLQIAGTCTPTFGMLYDGWKRLLALSVIWGLAVIGITLKAIFFTSFSPLLGMILYLILGWLGGIAAFDLRRRFGWRFAQPLVLGGVAFSVGAVMDSTHWPTLVPRVVLPHDVFHVAVLIGTIAHWKFIWSFASGQIHTE